MEEVEDNIELVINKIEDETKSRIQSPPGGFRGVFWQSWRAATRNPVEALRYE